MFTNVPLVTGGGLRSLIVTLPGDSFNVYSTSATSPYMNLRVSLVEFVVRYARVLPSELKAISKAE